jgi:hypothetical protein
MRFFSLCESAARLLRAAPFDAALDSALLVAAFSATAAVSSRPRPGLNFGFALFAVPVPAWLCELMVGVVVAQCAPMARKAVAAAAVVVEAHRLPVL